MERAQRTTKEQIYCYLNFKKLHPEFKLTKVARPQLANNEDLWKELVMELNTMKGPRRSMDKWKQSLSHWRNQLLSRARKEVNEKVIAAGEEEEGEDEESNQRAQIYEYELKDFEDTDQFFSCQEIKTEPEEEFIDIPIESESRATEPSITTTKVSAGATQSRRIEKSLASSVNRKRKFRDEMMTPILMLMHEQGEQNKRFHNENMKACFQVMDALSQMTSAINKLTEAIKNKNT